MNHLLPTLLLLLASCTGSPRQQTPRAPGQPEAGRPAPEAAQPARQPVQQAKLRETLPCSNEQYAFDCAVPQGYVLIQERRGPGTIMTFVKRALGSEEAQLSVRVTPLGKGSTLETFVERRVARDLQKAQGIQRWEKQDTVLGGRSGIELTVERNYASGPYRSRIFCFREGDNIFIIDHTVPAGRYSREKQALDSFLENLSFTAAP